MKKGCPAVPPTLCDEGACLDGISVSWDFEQVMNKNAIVFFVHNSFKFAGYTAIIKDKPTAFQKLLCCVIHLSFFSLPANGTALPCMGGAVLFYVFWEEYQCMRIFGKIYRFAVLLLRFLYKIRFKIFPGSGQVRNYMILYSWYLAVSLQLSFCADVTEPQHNVETDRIYLGGWRCRQSSLTVYFSPGSGALCTVCTGI